MHYPPGMRGDHEIEEYMAFTCYLLINTDSDSLKLKNLAQGNVKLHSCIFFSVALLRTLFTLSRLGLRPLVTWVSHWVSVFGKIGHSALRHAPKGHSGIAHPQLYTAISKDFAVV
jgi:hypothetical protein